MLKTNSCICCVTSSILYTPAVLDYPQQRHGLQKFMTPELMGQKYLLTKLTKKHFSN